MTRNGIFKSGNLNMLLFKGTTVIWLLIILFLSFIPSNDLPEVNGIPNIDKIVHFSLYFIFTILSLFTSLKTKRMVDKKFIFAGIFGIGLFVEVMQGILPLGRTFSVFDLLANVCGMLTGLLFFQGIKHLLQ